MTKPTTPNSTTKSITGPSTASTHNSKPQTCRLTGALLRSVGFLFFVATSFQSTRVQAEDLTPLAYNTPNLAVDLGVGLWAWPLPMDYDGDGDNDLVVSCPDKPYNGTYFFENETGNVKFPIFKPGRRVGPGYHNVRVCQVGSEYRVLRPRQEFLDFTNLQYSKPRPIEAAKVIHPTDRKLRAKQWNYADYDGNGVLDLIVAVGDWTEYGWDDAYNANGEWTNGPLRGFVYVLRNNATNETPEYSEPIKLMVGEAALEVFGWPSPNFHDWDGDGDIDLICGEFLDRLSWFENVGSKEQPQYAKGRFLNHDGQTIKMDLQMIVPSAIDWDKDGDVDLVVGDEDGRVALIENSGRIVNRMPEFLPPKYFQQQADRLKCGALATPYAYDWDNDGDEDIICGNTAGYIALYEQTSTDDKTISWAAPVNLKADGETIRIQAGPNGSIQGPCEAKWGYTTLTVADWNQDQLPDIMVNSIWGEILWYQNVGTRSKPRLAAAQKVNVEWPGDAPKPAWNWWNPTGKQLVSQWRTTPSMVDFNKDGLTDLVMLDHEGYLAFFERTKQGSELTLQPGKRIFIDSKGEPIRWNERGAGKSGRRKIHVVDWDGDGQLDFLLNGQNADWWKNVGERDGRVVLEDKGPLSAQRLAGHTSSPTTINLGNGNQRALLVGAEDGYLYMMPNPHMKR